MNAIVTLPDGREYKGHKVEIFPTREYQWKFSFPYDHVTPERFHPEWTGQRISIRLNYGEPVTGTIYALTDAERDKDNGAFSILVQPD